ncbi:para-aminobenzoate synthetase/4-amino-4-deoxychorismate lyase [Inhella inkyongensis]|uniref:Para-aminobenzoate synthetase/4-amino-4-deoxychorismate lyase n=1 Tax=Inhella inkyongensis TaxID=392593 RepID=A0A840S5J8_9BURK|nr:bifunctional anthranilate synthase component I family protein/class IV aminotransferase [Inhella inkyongensis]MBB5203901.1 para-aminobenzoate synthetase/4-amino-4-deoxychorismate lyase [Inhella inkyongensis]
MSAATQRPFAAFDFPRHPLAREDGERLRGAWFDPPAQWLLARRADELLAVIDAAHAQAQQGAWVLGGLRYEAAAALDPNLGGLPCEGLLAAFAVFESAPQAWPAEAGPERLRSQPWRQNLHEPEQDAASVEAVREAIRRGDCYQINLTTRLASTLVPGVDLAELFFALHAAQPGGFSLYLQQMGAGESQEGGVASVSPELFFDWRALPEHPKTWLLAAQPMKGTAARGVDRAGDEAAQAYLRTSEKERAENLMIVDLLRNDLGRVAQTGSVRVPRLFELHELPTVWQMTSTVTALTRPQAALSELFAALFPCGSVTGAPKRQAMQLIRELEAAPRSWYCGALGLIQPGGACTFNVPIRTVEVRNDGSLQAGVGSGITLDSEPAAELAEWRAKARFLERARAPIEAVETLRLEAGHYPLRGAHLRRMARCARHFGLHWDGEAALAELDRQAQALGHGCWRVRLSLARSGRFSTRIEPLQDVAQPVRLALAMRALDTGGVAAEFITHKTSRREAYDSFAADKPAGAWDLVLFNQAGELTEGCFGNLALLLDGQWWTPRAEAGLLAGVGREHWLAQGRVREAPLTLADWQRAEGLAWFNGLRGWLDAVKFQ